MKNACFQFYIANVTIFQTLCFSLTLPLSNPSQCKITFDSYPIILKQKSLQNHFKVFFLFCFIFCSFFLRVLKFGVFQKSGWGSQFCEMFSKILIGPSPICYVCICVGPMRHFNLVLRHFHSCSCLVHWCCALLHAKCLIECPSDILVLIWTQVSHFA